MNLKPRAIILLAIHHFGGKVEGKTLLQKRLYFTEILLGENLGFDFNAHFYGPYSAFINSEVSTLKLQGQLREDSSSYGVFNETGFEMRRYEYQLTKEGLAGVEWLQNNYPEDSKRLSEGVERVIKAGNFDYMALSFAAKSHWVLRHSKKQLSHEEIAKEASRFGWHVKPDQLESGFQFLRTVGLTQHHLNR
jgi:uncharacterized protein YwgA